MIGLVAVSIWHAGAQRGRKHATLLPSILSSSWPKPLGVASVWTSHSLHHKLGSIPSRAWELDRIRFDARSDGGTGTLFNGWYRN